MQVSDFISLGALLLSIVALLCSIKKGISSSNLIFQEKRNDVRSHIFSSTFKIYNLIVNVQERASTDRDLRIIQMLNTIAAEMLKVKGDMSKKVKVPVKVNISSLIADFDHILTDLEEFNIVLDLAVKQFEEEEFDKLEVTVKGLRKRILGNISLDVD